MGEAPEVNQSSEAAPGMLMGNLGEPIRITGFEVHGVAAEAAQQNQTIGIWRKRTFTSDDPRFFPIAEGLRTLLQGHASNAGKYLDLSNYRTVLLVAKSDKSAEIWADTAAVTIQMMARRSLEAGVVVFEHDVADVTGMAFPLVSLEPGDQVVCLFQEGWRYGLHFDFVGIETIDKLWRELGAIYRSLKYHSLYDRMAKPAIVERLTVAGWFPFAEIVGPEVQGLMQAAEAGFSLDTEEDALIARFDDARLERILERWLAKPHFKTKERILRSAIDAYRRDDPISTIKTLVTEVEGILIDAHAAVTGTRGKLGPALEFAAKSVEVKAGSDSSLMFPKEFGAYLKASTFADFDPITGAGTTASRHAVSHGATPEHEYTKARALQVILTLDQFAFYI